ncbi:MAG: hypothetical protein KGJ07_05430 [Patescibacteria group bacterium]|nr:hypothetical protein [Patescibacteria group bacterium]
MKNLNKILYIIFYFNSYFIFLVAVNFSLFSPKKLSVVLKTFQAKKTPFTELYFENNEHLPSKPNIITNYNAVPYTFSFTIHNLEYNDMNYSYIIKMEGVKNVIIDKSNIPIKDNEKKTITETFVLPNKIDIKTLISVSLLNKNQTISFWLGGQQ